MTKQLLLVRHGKATPGSAGESDFDRTLTKSGHQDASEMALRFKAKNFLPELLISSPAARALATAAEFRDTWKSAAEIQTDIRIYEAGTKQLLEVIANIPDQADTAAIFGHNPGITDLARYLTGAEIPNLPTSALVLIAFPFEEWKYISKHTGSLLLFHYPRS